MDWPPRTLLNDLLRKILNEIFLWKDDGFQKPHNCAMNFVCCWWILVVHMCQKRYLGTVFLWFLRIIDQQWHLFVYDMSPFGHKINQNWFPHQCSSHLHWLQTGKSKFHSNTLSGKMLKTHEICSFTIRVLCFIHICVSCPYFLNL